MRVPASHDDALAMLHTSLDYLTRLDWRDAGGHAQAIALRSLGTAQSKWTVAHAGALAAFDASGGYAGDGHPTPRTWLKHQARVSGRAARDLEDWTGRLAAHPLLREAMTAGEVSESWARQLAAWNDRLPAGEIDKADKILLDAVRARLSLYPDVARLAEAIYEAVRSRQPDQDPPDDGYRDRDVRLARHLGGAGRLTGDLSAECAALLATVFEAFGKNVGAEDLRNPGQRAHDALETALRLALSVPDIPQSSGMKSRVLAMLSLAGLIKLDGASAMCDAWLAARAGEPGFFTGPAAETIACTGQVTPVTTGTPDWDVLSDMADVFLDAHRPWAAGHHGHGKPADGNTAPRPGKDNSDASTDRTPQAPATGHDATCGSSGASVGGDGAGSAPRDPSPGRDATCGSSGASVGGDGAGSAPRDPAPGRDATCGSPGASVGGYGAGNTPHDPAAGRDAACGGPGASVGGDGTGNTPRDPSPRRDATCGSPGASDGGQDPSRPSACGCTCGGCGCPPPPGLRGPLSPAAQLALERTLLAMSIRALAGPGGLAGFLRANLLGRPFSGKSLILDVGDTDDIPDYIRRAVIARDRHCQWPGGCDRPAAQCEPHHHVPRHQGGETSLENLRLYCKAHHHHFIHRLGWQVIKHPDGTRDAISPDGTVIRGHQPPGHAPPGHTAPSHPA